MKQTSSRGIFTAAIASAAMIASVYGAGNGNGNGNSSSSTTTTTSGGTTTTTTTTTTTEPSEPRGGITATPIVKVGESPILNWQIAYPQTLQNVVSVSNRPDPTNPDPTNPNPGGPNPGGPNPSEPDPDKPDTVTPKTDLTMEVRVVGASYEITQNNKTTWGEVEVGVSLTNAVFKTNNGHGNNLDGVDVSNPGNGGGGPNGAVDASGSVDDERIFKGKQNQISPTKVVFPTSGVCVVKANSKVDFKARANNGSTWLPWRQTKSATANVVALMNGDTPPSTTPAFRQGKIETFLKPYMENGKIKIGPMDIIYLIELGQTSPSASGFDLQDMVLLVTFKPIQ